MRKLKSLFHVIAHAAVFTFAIHVWHCVASEHMLDAVYDVGLEHVVKLMEERAK